MSGEKCIHIFYPKYFCTSGFSLYGLEAIQIKFVGQVGERATA